ncbi:MAG: hypothetical protein AAFQ66_18000 [Pseudomonadota bacterium]
MTVPTRVRDLDEFDRFGRAKACIRARGSASIEGMIPDGVDEWVSKLSEDLEITLEKPGFY